MPRILPAALGLFLCAQAGVTRAEATLAPIDCATAIVVVDQSTPRQLTERYASARPFALRDGAVCAARRGDFATAEAMIAPPTADPADRLSRLDRVRIARAAPATAEGAEFVLRILPDSDELDAPLLRAAALLRLGRKEEAAAVVGALEGADERFVVQTDRRFEALWLPETEVETAAANDYAAMLDKVRAQLGSVRGAEVMLAAGDLRLGRKQPALGPALDPARIAELRSGAWTARHVRVEALVADNRLDEALAVVMAGLEERVIMEPAAPRAVETVTFALLGADRIEDAVRLTEAAEPKLRDTPPAIYPLLRECVFAQAGAAIRMPASPNLHMEVGHVLDALVCARREEDAAQVLIAGLADPERRSQVLLWAQKFREWPAPGRIGAELRRRRADLLDRPEVQAAIQREGRVLALPLYGPF